MSFKYVIFKAGTLMLPVFFPEHVVHSMVLHEDGETGKVLKPHSAGFFHLDKGHVVISKRKSDSLGIGPKVYDRDWIERSLSGMGTAFFICEPDGRPML